MNALTEQLIAFLGSVISTGTGTLTTPSITENVSGYEVTEVVTVTVKKV